jgi:poly-gamma-glutamate capsule biosynthesis protein CapA/YwtB (metallophosphatase superfamily)
VSAGPLRLLLAGDAMLGRGVDDMIARHGVDWPLAGLKPALAGADLFAVNLECAITAADTWYRGPAKAFYFRARPAAAELLRRAGVGLCTLANNHALDAGPEGLLDTLDILRNHGIASVGAGADADAAWTPAVLQVAGWRVGVLACCDHQPDFAAGPRTPGIAYLDVADPAQVQALLQRTAPLAAAVGPAIVALHWQPNWVPWVSADYQSLAQRLVEAGARLVWGHSPHHFLGVQWLGSSVVLYSTGGLIDDYAVDTQFRNDRQLLFEIGLAPGRVQRVRALPLELDFAFTALAKGAVRQWIVDRFAAQCRTLGSALEDDSDWLTVSPAQHCRP